MKLQTKTTAQRKTSDGSRMIASPTAVSAVLQRAMMSCASSARPRIFPKWNTVSLTSS
jgi:hypothetical protein